MFHDIGHSNKEILGRPVMLPCLVSKWPQIMLIRISLRSRSSLVLDALVLDADHSLDFLGTYLVFTDVYLVL